MLNTSLYPRFYRQKHRPIAGLGDGAICGKATLFDVIGIRHKQTEHVIELQPFHGDAINLTRRHWRTSDAALNPVGARFNARHESIGAIATRSPFSPNLLGGRPDPNDILPPPAKVDHFAPGAASSPTSRARRSIDVYPEKTYMNLERYLELLISSTDEIQHIESRSTGWATPSPTKVSQRW